MSHLRRIGALCFIHDERRPRTKLQPRSKLGILVGYAANTRGYRVWCPDNGTYEIRETQSVRFDEKRIGTEALRNAKKTEYVEFQLEDENLSTDASKVTKKREYVEFHLGDGNGEIPALAEQKTAQPQKTVQPQKRPNQKIQGVFMRDQKYRQKTQ